VGSIWTGNSSVAVNGLQDMLLVYITRFNLNFRKSVQWQGMDPDWISKRIRLLQQFLLPSLKGQLDQDFIWLVLVHPNTPRDGIQKIKHIPQCRVFRTDVDIGDPTSFVAQSVKYLHKNFKRKILITARLDSDDGINRSYGKHLKVHAAHHNPSKYGYYVDFPKGCFFNTTSGKGYIRMSPSRSCGVSKTEYFGLNAKTIHSENHTRIAKRRNCASIITDDPMWIQTTHGCHINRPGKCLPDIRREDGTDLETSDLGRVFPFIDQITS